MYGLAIEIYGNLFTSKGVYGMEHVSHKVSEAMNYFLMTPYMEEEVKHILFQMSRTKTLGLDVCNTF